jgi:hypothetical protein
VGPRPRARDYVLHMYVLLFVPRAVCVHILGTRTATCWPGRGAPGRRPKG